MKFFQRPILLLSFLVLAVVARATIGTGLQLQLGNPSNATADPTNRTRYLIQRPQYSLDYNDTQREPNWVAWNLTSTDVGSSGRSPDFFADTSLPAGFYQVLPTDYSGSGYDRGHMTPSGDRTITRADNDATFLMTNIVPQAPDNNQGVWASFETECRSLAAAGNEILIVSGPGGYAGSTIASGVAIPGYVWKIAVVVPLGAGTALSRIDANTRVIAIKIPNVAGVRNNPWQQYITSAAQLQTDTGLTFFTDLSPSIASALRTKVDGQTATGAPVITTQPTAQSAAVGGSAAFAVTASSTPASTLTYQWLKNDDAITGATNASLNLNSVTATSAGTYTVVVTNNVSAVTSAAAALVITGIAPTISANPPARTIAAGGSATFTVSASGSPTLTYQWRKGATNLTNSATIAGALSATLTLTNVQAAEAGNYNVVVTNSVNSATSADAALSVTPAAPTIVTAPAAQSVTIGSTVALSVTASGTAPFTYQWRKGTTTITDGPTGNGSTFSGALTATLTLTNAQSADAANYDVVVSNTIAPSATSTTAALTVSATATPSLATWTFGAGAGTENPAPTSGLPSDVTGGTVTQGNNNGTTTLVTATSPSSGTGAYTGNSGTNNAGAAARTGALNQTATTGSAYFQFTLTPATANKQIGVTALTFGSRSTGTGPQAYSIFSSVDNFTTALATGTLLANSAWAQISPTFTSVTGPTGAPITFRIYGHSGTGSPGTNTANWRIDDLKVTLTTTAAAPTAPAIASTSPTTGATAVNGASPITVTFNQAVTVSSGWFSITSAATGAVAATVTGGPTTYTFTPPVNFTENDTVTVTLSAAQITDSATLTLRPAANTTFSFTTAAPVAPGIATAPVATTAAAGGTATFTVVASGTAPFSYVWRKGGTPITGNGSATTPTLTLTNVQTGDAANYDVEISNGIAPAATSTPVALTVTPTAPVVVTHPIAATAVHGANVTFTVAATGTTPLTYLWRRGGNALANGTSANNATVSGATTATLTLTGVTSADVASYDVVVSNGVNPSATSNAAALAVTLPPAGPTANYAGNNYHQDFNTLPSTGTFTLSGSGSTVVALSAASPSGVGASGMTGWSISRYAGTNTTGASAVAPPFTINNGSSNSGSIYSFGTTVTAPVTNDRALGTVSSGSTVGRFGVSFVNTTTTTITQVTVSYVGEQWRHGGVTTPNKLTFAYAIGANDINIGSFTAVPQLDFTAPIVTNTTLTLDGNLSANRVAIVPFSISGLTWAPGQTITLRWTDVDDTGSDDGLAVDDFSFTAAPALDLQPQPQTIIVGATTTLRVQATGTGTLSYQWRKDGNDLAEGAVTTGTRTATLTLTNATTADAGSYYCLVTNALGSTPSDSATLTVNKATAPVVLAGLNATFNGTARAVTATTTPGGLSVAFTYDGNATLPTNAGTYAVVATINDANYLGSATGSLVIAPATATVTLSGLTAAYDGIAKVATATTSPAALPVAFTYDGGATAPIAPGSFAVVGTITHPNYTGSASGTLVIGKGTATVTLGNLAQTYNGFGRPVSAVTVPAGLPVDLTYNGSPTPPVNPGSYAIVATVNDVNYTGTASGLLVVSKASATITLANLNQTYTGTPRAATATSGTPVASIRVTYSGDANAPTNAGSYAVTATIEDANYSGSATGTLTIAKASQTIAFGPLPSAPTVGAAFSVSATASSGLPVTLAVASGNATASGSSITLLDTSPVTLRATQAGDNNTQAATTETTLTGTAAPLQTQTITFAALADRPTTAAPFALTATASSGLGVGFELLSGPATLSNGTVTLTGTVGTVVLRATQAGNTAFAPAPPVERSFRVIRAGFAGVYFGTLGNGGTFALIINADFTGVFLAFAPGSRTAYISRSIVINSDGRFRFVTTTTGGGTPAANVGTPPIAAAIDDLIIEGTIAADGTLSGASTTGAALSLSGNRTSDTGNAAATAGFYQAGAAGTSATTFAIVSPTGQALVVTQLGSVVDGGTGTVDGNGRLALTTAGQQAVVATLSAENAALNASITTAAGASTLFSGVAANSAAATTQRIVNISTRTTAGSGDQVAIVGFVIAGSESKTVLVRAVGPALRNFGVATALTAPRLELLRSGNSTPVAINTGWSGGANSADLASAAARSGAFALTAGSADAAILTTLTPGNYTAIVSAANGAAGIGLVEVYDISGGSSAQRLANLSTRAAVGTGDSTLIAGVVVSGTTPKRVLIRAAGPALAQFGVSGVLARPVLTLFSGSTNLGTNAGWSTSTDATAITEAALRTGAFAFGATSADAAMVVNLAPGAYTAQVTGVGNTTGVALVEIYELP